MVKVVSEELLIIVRNDGEMWCVGIWRMWRGRYMMIS